MNRLMEHYCRVIEEVYAPMSIPISRYEYYVEEMSRMAITFPPWLKHENLFQLGNMDDRERTSLVIPPLITQGLC